MKDFEPTIVGFLCNWCSYSAADSAGSARKLYPHNLRIIRLMCSGSVDPQYVLKAFKEGADGVVIMGCHPGDCHYKEGNFKTLRRYEFLKKMLEELGIENDRFRLDWISAGESDKFVQVVNEMVDKIRLLGPLHL